MEDTTLPPNLKLKKITKIRNNGKEYPVLTFEPEDEEESIVRPGDC